ncbi:MAG: PKD domain-containing protein [Chitinophagaceae bacterium]|nr:PKD domain-containing protein [Chitinophagaceae bacterium]
MGIRHFLVFLLIFLSQWAKTQVPVANFSGTPATGCAPLVVTFTDQSSGSPRSWNWDFGNGQLSNVQNPVVVFSQPGIYSVTLVVKNGSGTHGITKTNYITVNPSPQADFSANITTGCVPVNVQFSDLSTDPAGSIISWDWDFGDGTKSTARNPSKTYAVNGFYSVSLAITSSTGCKSVIGRNRYIRIVSGVKADFNNTVNGNCRPPFTANFSNQSAGPGSLTYAWDFGNGNNSTLRNPSSPYNAPGSYPVTLTTTSDFGCSNTIQKNILIRNSSTIIGGPDSICVNKPLNFVNTSSPGPVSSIWYFDDGTQSTAINATKTFLVPGPHIVKLVNTYSFCKDSVTKTITVVTPPPVDFTSSTVLACRAPLTVSFTDISPDAVAWAWNFGDGGVSTLQNPTHTYNSAGQFNVGLTVTNRFGCINTLIKNVFVQIVKPIVDIESLPGEGCVPFTFSPVPDISAVDGVAAYLWDFGDGPGSTRTGVNPSYTYNTPGNYTLTLTITTIGGCTETASFPNGVKVGTLPFVDFTADKFIGCASDSFRFTSLATPSTKWLWDFGDGTTDTLENPVHGFADTGTLSVSLTGYNNGCRLKVTKPDYIKIVPPVSRFQDTVLDCANKYTVDFINKSIVIAGNPVTYSWNFAGLGTSTAISPTFNFPGPGIYNVSLTVTDPSPSAAGCPTHTYTKAVSLIYETANFTASKRSVCKNERFTLTAGGDTTKITKYQWRLGNGTIFTGRRTFDTSFTTNGSHDIELIVTNKYGGCTDTAIISGFIAVVGPVADFNPAVPGTCQSKAVTFNDLTTSAVNISKWTWDFGDSIIRVFTAPPFTHTYADTGTYSVKLIVQDINGCTDTLLKDSIVIISRPLAFFGATDTIYCQGKNLQFIDSSQGYSLNYLWNFGDGANSTLQNPTHAYTGADATYSVKLKITDAFGCTDSLTRINFVDIRYPKAAFNAIDTISICPPLETKFFNLGQNYESFSWDFGDGAGSTLQDPTHFYNTYGSFTAKLYLIGYGGCEDSSSHSVNIYNPPATSSLTYSPLDACNSLNVDFSIVTPPQTRFTFFYGDGLLDTSQAKTFSYFYSSPNFYYPSLLLYDNLGCIASVSGPQVIKVLGAIPNFARDRKEFCDSGAVFFTNYTIANDPITSSVWNFDDGNTSTDQDPTHYFAAPDQYAVSLNVTTQAGCNSVLVDTIKVYRTPDPSITSLDIACINTPVLFNGNLAFADTAITWAWNFGNGKNSSAQDVSSIYTQTGTYKISLEAANRLGCKKSFSKDIVIAPLPVITMGPDPVIPVGTGIDLPVTYSNNIRLYSWSPSNNLTCIDCAVPYANPKFTTRYKVSVTDSNGCRANSDVTVRVVCNNKNYFVPNTFTPNGDGVNDVFYPRGSSIDRIQSMRVFNRWGQIVFEKKNFMVNSISEGWNGVHQGRPSSSDTYVYIIEYLCENGEIVPIKGNVTLLR